MRQYNNLIALLDNYDEFKINVDIAADSDGTLSEQMQPFEEGWEAAANGVKTALESIY
jgi:hypothetical protein